MLVGAVDVVQTTESRLSPDAESADMATRSDLEQVQVSDVQQGDAFKKIKSGYIMKEEIDINSLRLYSQSFRLLNLLYIKLRNTDQ